MGTREIKILEVSAAPGARRTASSYPQQWWEGGTDASLWEAPFPLGRRGFRRTGHVFRTVSKGQSKSTVCLTQCLYAVAVSKSVAVMLVNHFL